MQESQEPPRRCTRYGAVTAKGDKAAFPPILMPRKEFFYFSRYLVDFPLGRNGVAEES